MSPLAQLDWEDRVTLVLVVAWALWTLGRILEAIREQTVALKNQPTPGLSDVTDRLDGLDYELKAIREDLSAIRYAVENRDD